MVPGKGDAIVVDAEESLVGREATSNIVVPHPSVSRRHALIKRKQNVFFVVDQGSANGTFVDSKRIVDAPLRDGSVLRFGSASFKIEVRGDAHGSAGHESIGHESIGEDELVVAPTMVGHMVAPQSFAATVLEGSPISEEGAAYEPAPTMQSPVVPSPITARPEPSRAPAPEASPLPVVAKATDRGPAFWLMIGAGALALLFVGVAMGLAVAFIARRLGWL